MLGVSACVAERDRIGGFIPMQSWKWLVVTLACVLGVSVLASAGKNTMGVADQQRITFTGTVRIGDVLLPKGDYQIRHVMESENHIMVFHQLNSKSQDVRMKCSLQPLGQKADQTQKIYTVNSANEQVMQAIIFRGDTAKHVFE
jgi:hypothetical protein